MTHSTRDRHMTQPLRRFWSDQSGSQSVEAMLMLPIMVWCFLATWVFFDAYRTQAINAKAGYLIGDIVSRESIEEVTPEYVDNMYLLQQELIDARQMPSLRITVARYQEDIDSLIVVWSETRGTGADLTDGRLSTMRAAIPEMSDGERVVIVQSTVDYEPVYGAGIARMNFDDFVVTSPRFSAQICFNSVNDTAAQTAATRLC